MTQVFVATSAVEPVQKNIKLGLAQYGGNLLRRLLDQAGLDAPDALYVSNMLADELQGQKHLGALIASGAGLRGIEAYQVRAAMASGAMALRNAYLAVKSGEVRTAVALGLEIMQPGDATAAMAKALDATSEIPEGLTMIGINARLFAAYLDKYKIKHSSFANFARNAHHNGIAAPHALFKQEFSREQIINSRVIEAPIRLMDCAPICDGAAAMIFTSDVSLCTGTPVELLASEIATDILTVSKRSNPLSLDASRLSAQKAFKRSGLRPVDIDFFELHDAFSIMACLSLEACGFAEPGKGWQMAEDGVIFREGDLPIATFGGLKSRGHPIGATALYQAHEIVCQLRGEAGDCQIRQDIRTGMMQSIGGAGTTLATNIFKKV